MDGKTFSYFDIHSLHTSQISITPKKRLFTFSKYEGIYYCLFSFHNYFVHTSESIVPSFVTFEDQQIHSNLLLLALRSVFNLFPKLATTSCTFSIQPFQHFQFRFWHQNDSTGFSLSHIVRFHSMCFSFSHAFIFLQQKVNIFLKQYQFCKVQLGNNDNAVCADSWSWNCHSRLSYWTPCNSKDFVVF